MIPALANRLPGPPSAPTTTVRSSSDEGLRVKRRGAAVDKLALPRTPTPPLDAPPWLGVKTVSPTRVAPLLNLAMEHLASQPALRLALERSDHRDIFAALDVNNILGLWRTTKKPPALPIKERHAFTAAIASHGAGALALLLGPPETLLQRFRARCASLTDSAWQQAGSAHPALQQLYAGLWHLGAHLEISLTFGFKDASSRDFSRHMLRPILTVVALGGLDDVPQAATILAAGRAATKRLAYVSGLELTLQDPLNFFGASPLCTAFGHQAAGASTSRVRLDDSFFASAGLKTNRASGATAPTVLLGSQEAAPMTSALPPGQSIQPPSRARTPVEARAASPIALGMSFAPTVPAVAPMAYKVRVNGQELVLTAELMASLAYGTVSEAAAHNNP